MKKAPALRSPELTAALEQAVAGRPDDLFRQLELGSGLPGPRMNMHLALAFGHECARIGPRADDLAYRMASLPPDEARGASPKEFLSVCGVLAVALLAAHAEDDHSRERALALLEERADDLRFRVRESVPIALAALGHRMGGELAARLGPWMDRYFHAAAVILALADPSWLETFDVAEHVVPIRLLDRAFVLAHDAPRSAARYPGHKALVEALELAPNALAKRFGIPMFEALQRWAEDVKLPELRAVILANLEDPRLKKPFSNEIRRIKESVEAGKKPPRDPTRIVHGTRGRGKKRS